MRGGGGAGWHIKRLYSEDPPAAQAKAGSQAAASPAFAPRGLSWCGDALRWPCSSRRRRSSQWRVFWSSCCFSSVTLQGHGKAGSAVWNGHLQALPPSCRSARLPAGALGPHSPVVPGRQLGAQLHLSSGSHAQLALQVGSRQLGAHQLAGDGGDGWLHLALLSAAVRLRGGPAGGQEMGQR